MDRELNEPIEENSEQSDDAQAQDVASDAMDLLQDAERHDPVGGTDHGGASNPAMMTPDDVPDLIDTMNQMLTSGRIDNGAFVGEPKMDDEEDLLGQTDTDEDDDGLRIDDE